MNHLISDTGYKAAEANLKKVRVKETLQNPYIM
jgi:hypothetical protein